MNRPVQIDADESEQPARFTAAEFLRMCDAGAFDDMKVELIGGELYRMTPPFTDHARLQAEVSFVLKTLLRDKRDLTVFGEVGVVVSDDTAVGPDVAVARIDANENRRLVPGDLLLVVEIASTTLAKDSGIKRFAYAAAAIPNYWIVDTQRRVIHLYAEPVAGDYADVRTVRFGEPFTALDLGEPITIG